MIRKSDKLFDFIQAMTSHERGYFKQSSNKDSFYVILFDAICKQKVYDEEDLAVQLKKKGCSRKISAMKEYLWRELTQAMAPYHLIKTPIGEAMARMQALHLMQHKGLTRHISRELDALKKFCSRYELYDSMLQAMQFEFRFGFHQLSLNEDYWKQFHEIVHANMLYMQLSEIQHRLHVHVLGKKQQRPGTREFKETEALLSHPVLNDPVLDVKVRLKVIKVAILELRAHLQNDYQAIIQLNMEIAELLESMPHLIKDGREISLIYANIAIALANAGQRQKLAAIIDEIIDKLHNIPHNQLHRMGHELEVKLIRMLALDDYRRLDEITAEFNSHYQVIPVLLKDNLYFNICVCLYKSGRTDDALDRINDALIFYRRHKRTTNINIYTLKLLHIFIHYEKGNLVYARNQTESFIRSYKPEIADREKDLIYVTLKYLNRAFKSPLPDKDMQKLSTRLDADFAQAGKTIYLSIPQWVNSMLHRRKPQSVAG